MDYSGYLRETNLRAEPSSPADRAANEWAFVLTKSTLTLLGQPFRIHSLCIHSTNYLAYISSNVPWKKILPYPCLTHFSFCF